MSLPKFNLEQLQAKSRKRHKDRTEPVWKSRPVVEDHAPEENKAPEVVPKPAPIKPAYTYLEKLDFEARVARIRAIAARIDGQVGKSV